MERARSLFAAFSRGIEVVGKEPQQAYLMKLGENFLAEVVIPSTCEALVFAAQQRVKPEIFFAVQFRFYVGYPSVATLP